MNILILLPYLMNLLALQNLPSPLNQLNVGRQESISTLSDTVRIQLEKTAFNDMSVLFISDTAETTQAISKVLGTAYGELMKYVSSNKLQPRRFMAWYYSSIAPWPMEIAVETNPVNTQPGGRIKTRVQKGGEVLIAHMWGPYDQVSKAYTRIETWLRENNRRPKGHPFEVYINDPSSVSSPYEIQTDIYQPLE
jgi:effector-binding domain-containing protein